MVLLVQQRDGGHLCGHTKIGVAKLPPLLAFCASGPETGLQRLSRSGTRLLAGYRAGYALHQLHLPLGSEGGAFGDLFNAAFADQFLLTENCETRFAFL